LKGNGSEAAEKSDFGNCWPSGQHLSRLFLIFFADFSPRTTPIVSNFFSRAVPDRPKAGL
jgi:hypothetical protein